MRINRIEERKNMCKEAVKEIQESKYNRDNVGKAAKKILEKYNICGNVPIVKIITDAGFDIYSQNMNDNVGGYIAIGTKVKEKFGKDSIIVVNGNESVKRQRFSLAHEFGHFLLDPDVINSLKNATPFYYAFEADDNKNELELLIDRFAAEILMPFDIFKKTYKNLKSDSLDMDDCIFELSEFFNVPVKSVCKRIDEVV